MRFAVTFSVAVLLTACGDIVQEPAPAAPRETARILLVGDVMLGRGVAASLAAEPSEVFAGVRHLLNGADIAGANLESPLTTRPQVSQNENVLSADPGAAGTLAGAGFDLMSLPNNHSSDAGPGGVLDTIAAVASAGMQTVGAGPDRVAATAPLVMEVDGLKIGFLAFDATGVGTPATDEPGVARWAEDESLEAVRALRRAVDIIVVSLHGGIEYLTVSDPGMEAIARQLAVAGADVVWGHGAHAVQPVQLLEGTRPTVAATSLGNFLFDQNGPGRTTGALLEVMVDADGLVAYRVGISEHPDRRIEFVEWQSPAGDAAWLYDSWWTLAGPAHPTDIAPIDMTDFPQGDVFAAGRGDVTGDGREDLVVSFRRPHRSTPFMELHPEVQWADAQGRSAHLGVYEPAGLGQIWVAGSVLMPVADLVVCDGAIATLHDQLDDPEVVAAGAWEWNGFGFDTAPDIPGGGVPGCADIDGDGRTEPVITGR